MSNARGRFIRWGSISTLLLVLLSQFVNCGQYNDATDNSSSETTLVCDANSCMIPNADNLAIKALLPGGASEYGLSASLIDFNLGGDCNEGAFPFNTIFWEMYLNGAKVRDSNMTGMNTANAAASVNTICTNGRFQLYVNMAAISLDPVNRTGCLTATGTRAQYDLYISILGRPNSSAAGYANTLTGRTHVALLAD